jgi:enamine deaminase RidA (YjgF/YER057c/UK114 family)
MENSNIEFVQPESLFRSPAFSHVAVVSGNHKTIYIGGQNAIDRDGKIVGKGNLEQQAQQVLTNLEAALKSAGAGFENVVKWNIYFQKGQSAQVGFKVFQPVLSKLKSPPLVTGIFVEALANPDYLLEIEAIAVVPE